MKGDVACPFLGFWVGSGKSFFKTELYGCFFSLSGHTRDVNPRDVIVLKRDEHQQSCAKWRETPLRQANGYGAEGLARGKEVSEKCHEQKTGRPQPYTSVWHRAIGGWGQIPVTV